MLIGIYIWWVEAMVCFCFLKNVVDLLINGETAYFNRFGVNFDGPIIPFGAEIAYLPISQKDKARVHQMGDKLLPGIFIGYDVFAGGGWTGDLLVVDWDNLNDAVNYSEVHVKRFKAPEVQVIKYGARFSFPLAHGDLQQPGPKVREVRQRRSRLQHEQEKLAQEELLLHLLNMNQRQKQRPRNALIALFQGSIRTLPKLLIRQHRNSLRIYPQQLMTSGQ